MFFIQLHMGPACIASAGSDDVAGLKDVVRRDVRDDDAHGRDGVLGHGHDVGCNVQGCATPFSVRRRVDLFRELVMVG